MSNQITEDGNQLILLIHVYKTKDSYFVRADSLPGDNKLLMACGTAAKGAVEEVLNHWKFKPAK